MHFPIEMMKEIS